jgi:hypothetical protein
MVLEEIVEKENTLIIYKSKKFVPMSMILFWSQEVFKI